MKERDRDWEKETLRETEREKRRERDKQTERPPRPYPKNHSYSELSETNFGICFASIRENLSSILENSAAIPKKLKMFKKVLIGSSGDGEFTRWVVHEMGSTGDGSLRDGWFTRWGVLEIEFYDMGSLRDGEFSRWEVHVIGS